MSDAESTNWLLDWLQRWWVVVAGTAAGTWYSIQFLWKASALLQDILTRLKELEGDIKDLRLEIRGLRGAAEQKEHPPRAWEN